MSFDGYYQKIELKVNAASSLKRSSSGEKELTLVIPLVVVQGEALRDPLINLPVYSHLLIVA